MQYAFPIYTTRPGTVPKRGTERSKRTNSTYTNLIKTGSFLRYLYTLFDSKQRRVTREGGGVNIVLKGWHYCKDKVCVCVICCVISVTAAGFAGCQLYI